MSQKKLTRKLTPKAVKKNARVDWRVAFLKELARTGNVSAAAKKAKIERATAYKARNPAEHSDELGKLTAQAFAKSWDDALEVATDALELEARRRANDGWLRPVFYQGEECGRVREHSDTLLIFLLKAHRPERFRENAHVDLGGRVQVDVNDLEAVRQKRWEKAGAAIAQAVGAPAAGDPGEKPDQLVRSDDGHADAV